MTELPPKHTFRKEWLIIGLAFLLLLLFLLGWIPRIANSKRVDDLAAEQSLPKVSLFQLKVNTKPIELILPTSLQGGHITFLWARVNGYLLKYLVDIGDVVKKGDLLAEIDTPETDAELAQAKADLANAIAERDIAKITRDRWLKLWDKNVEAVSKQEVDQYVANLKAANATVVANEQNVSRLTYQQQFKYIYASFDGIITQRLADIGTLIYGNLNGTPQALFQIAQTDLVRCFVDVPQTYFRQIKEGLDAEVTVLQFPGQIFKGTLTRYAKALDPTARTLLTQVDVDNKEGLLYAGLYGRVKFLLHPETINYIIPTTAVIIHSGFPHVAKVDENNTVHLIQVQIGRDYGNQMEISSVDLKESDRIVKLPTDKILEGAKVDIISDQK